MAHSKFSLDGPAFENSTRQVIPPDHVMRLQEEEEVLEAGVDTQILQTPPGSPAPQEEQLQGEQAAHAPENSLLKCIMENACNSLHAFQEYERYFFGVNPASDCDDPEDEHISSDEDQQVPVNLQEVEGSTEGYHGQHSPKNIPVDDTIAVEENSEPSVMNDHVTLVNDQVTEPLDPSTAEHLDFNIATFDSVYPEADQEVIPEIQWDVAVQTVTTTSAAGGESSSSSRILMDFHVDPNPLESEDSYELLHEAVNGNSIDSMDVNESPLKRAIEAGAPET